MSQSRLTQRRSVLTGLLAVGLVPLAGCMSKPVRPANSDGTYCHAIGKWHSRKLTCTTAPIPSEQAEAQAKRLEAAAGLLTVYVVRKRWGDARNEPQRHDQRGNRQYRIDPSGIRPSFLKIQSIHLHCLIPFAYSTTIRSRS